MDNSFNMNRGGVRNKYYLSKKFTNKKAYKLKNKLKKKKKISNLYNSQT